MSFLYQGSGSILFVCLFSPEKQHSILNFKTENRSLKNERITPRWRVQTHFEILGERAAIIHGQVNMKLVNSGTFFFLLLDLKPAMPTAHYCIAHFLHTKCKVLSKLDL